mmetsp:Transcript_19529/g.21720  ORF Transcript_19529/g.21720 Transcript_19529/m.21720 type:complete len:300 (+) Transcript_19529:474-1373(+)
MEGVGSLWITGTGIDQSIVKKMFDETTKFFQMPLEYKRKLIKRSKMGRGYIPFETENGNKFAGRDGFPNDPIEKFGIGPLHVPNEEVFTCDELSWFYDDNVWPDRPRFELAWRDYTHAMRNLLFVILRISSMALGIDEEKLIKAHYNGPFSLKGMNYPKVENPKENQNARFPEHTDIGTFTILSMTDAKDSLQVKNVSGNWIPVDPEPGCFFLNIGETMARWTNDRWRATPHRVIWPSIPQQRMSFGFFALPRPDTPIDCIIQGSENKKYPSITMNQMFQERMAGLAGLASTRKLQKKQ